MRVKFSDLEPQWCKFVESGWWRENGEDGSLITPQDADGIIFFNPQEFERGGGASKILLWFRGKVPDTAHPGPGRWDLINADFEHFEVGPSIDLTQDHGHGPRPDAWHGWIKDGWCT